MNNKLILVKAAAISVWIALVPIHPAIISVMSLPLIDLVLALLIAQRKGTPITSAGLKRTVAKILMYEVAVVLAFVTETYLLSSLVPAVKLVTGIIGMTELKSCLEHLDELSGNSLYASLLKKLAPDQPSSPTTVVEESSTTVITSTGGTDDAVE